MSVLVAYISALAAFGLVLQSPDILLGRMLGNREFQAAKEYVATNYKPGGKAEPAARWARLGELTVDDAGNATGFRKGHRQDSIVAVAAYRGSVSGIETMSALIEAVSAAQINTNSSLVFVLLADGQGLEYFLQKGAYSGRIAACVFIGDVAEGTILGPPNSIGSTIVQYGLQTISAFSLEPEYEGEMGHLSLPMSMRIPAIELGSRENEVSVRSIQIVMTAVLAIAGV